MKRMLSLLLILCLLLPAAALGEETLPKVKFPAANYVGYLDSECVISMEFVKTGSFTDSIDLELRSQDGRVMSTQKYKPGQKLNFILRLDETFLGGFDLSVWYGDQQISINSAYLAVGDKHRKAVTKVDTPENLMAVSIDCTYEDDQTDAILAVLEENNVKATFFLAGTFVLYYPESAQKILDAGHEIGNSSWTHPHLLEKGMDIRFSQVRKGSQIIREQLGVEPKLFMPPYADFDSTVSAPARAEGMEVVLWTIDSKDWDEQNKENPAVTVRRATKDVEAGYIVLFHLDGYNTAQVLAEALPYYKNTLGLTPVTISELIASAANEPTSSPETEIQAEPEAEAQTEPEAEPQPEAQAESGTEPQAEAQTESETEPKAEPEAEPQEEPQEEPRPEIQVRITQNVF